LSGAWALCLACPTRQADRDKVHADVAARHREDLAMAYDPRLAITEKHTEQLVELLQHNTRLTQLTRQLSQRIEMLTVELHHKIVRKKNKAGT